ncbi:MAG: 30S ribosomal protein S7 [Sumerlaeia bacterium]
MARRRVPPGRGVFPDVRFNSLLVSKFINCLMWDGKKSVAEGVFYNAMDAIGERITDKEAIEVFQEAIENVKPAVEVKSRRVGGANYQVPIEVKPERRQALAIRWIIEAARGRNEKTMMQRLTNEIIDASNKSGSAITKMTNVRKMAEANKAFAHYRF